MQQGFTVDAEVNHCDLVAIKRKTIKSRAIKRAATKTDKQKDELIVVELKLSPNIKLLIQATDRQRLTNEVYVAVPEPARVNKHWRGIERVIKRLGLGLILVRQSPLGRSARTTIVPSYSGDIDSKARASLLAELSGRSMSYKMVSDAGHNLAYKSVHKSTGKIKPVTAYKEIAITIASILHHLGPQQVCSIKKICGDKTQGILANNHYGWFERVKRGTYTLTDEGQVSLREFPDLQARALNLLSEA